MLDQVILRESGNFWLRTGMMGQERTTVSRLHCMESSEVCLYLSEYYSCSQTLVMFITCDVQTEQIAGYVAKSI